MVTPGLHLNYVHMTDLDTDKNFGTGLWFSVVTALAGMGNCCKYRLLNNNNLLEDEGQPPGVNPAVLFDITYWEEPSSTEFTEQKGGVGQGLGRGLGRGLGGATNTPQTGLDCVKATQAIRSVSLQFVKIII